ncbi:putative quinol monooxygenase [Streptomyces sp. NPDC048045]|uniref:putative quinol monooxygenase n=1 Tax=Streptomyces sp. NPDC048045 TaxID=3154710 RepID=UPI00343969CE
MIFIAVKYRIRPHLVGTWLDRVDAFTQATRSEPGNVFFEWSRSADDLNDFTLLEAFTSPEAGEAHVTTAHFADAMAFMPDYIAERPQIIYIADAPDGGWGPMAELTPRTASET